jgi:soluble lytic murein transglycosylase-like protein
MSGYANISAVPDQNILYNAASGATLLSNQNALLQQQKEQQAIGGGEIEMMARAAASLQDPTLYPTTEARAAAYPTLVAQLQRQGFAKNAPPTYPGDAQIAALARMGTPSATQAEWGFNRAANKAYADASNPPPTPTASGTTPATVAAPPTYGTTTAQAPAEYEPYFQEASRIYGIPVDVLKAQAAQESSFNPNATGKAGEIGIMQIHPNTAKSPGYGIAGIGDPTALRDPRTNIMFGAAYLAARAKGLNADLTTPAGQAAALTAYNGGGDPQYAAHVFGRLAPPASRAAPAGTTAQPVIIGDSIASSQGLGGQGVVGASPRAVLSQITNPNNPMNVQGRDVVLSGGASNNPQDVGVVEQQVNALKDRGARSVTVVGVGADNPKFAGVNEQLQQIAQRTGARFVPLGATGADGVHPADYGTLKVAVQPPQGAPQGGPGGGGAGGRYQVAGPVVASSAASTAPAAATAQTLPQPPTNRVMPGGANGPPIAEQPPPPPPQAPAGGPQPPQLQPLNAKGLTPLQQRQIDAQALDPRFTVQDRIKQEQALAQVNLGNQQKAFQDWIQLQQLQTSQGQLSVSQQNSALEYWKATHRDAKVTQVGGEIITQDSQTGKEIAPRIQVGMDRPEAQAAAVVARLGPRIAAADAGTGPPVTPEERAEYAVQAGIYRNPKVQTDPITKGLIHVNERELPPGFPEPGGATAGGSQQITPGMSPAQQAVEKKLGENFADQDTKAYAGANNSLYALGQMNNAAEILDRQGASAWTATGPAANLRISAAQGVNTLGSLFGVAPSFDPAAIGTWEALNKQTKLMGFKIINAAFGASREAASVINNATSAVPSAENTYLGFRLVSSGIEQELQRERELYEFKADRVRSGQPLATAEAEFNKAHPVSAYTSRAIANAVPDDIAAYLTAHPDTVKAFDGHFGPGIGEFILRGGRTGLGTEARRQ